MGIDPNPAAARESDLDDPGALFHRESGWQP
jgi:hypothetical protein